MNTIEHAGAAAIVEEISKLRHEIWQRVDPEFPATEAIEVDGNINPTCLPGAVIAAVRESIERSALARLRERVEARQGGADQMADHGSSSAAIAARELDAVLEMIDEELGELRS